MKWSLFLFGSLLVCLSGCQNLPAYFSMDNPPTTSREIEQLVDYGAKFAFEYQGAAQATCLKYKQRYQDGDWRAGWVLALHVTEAKGTHCLKSKQALKILTALETQKLINPELLWLTHVHISWLNELTKETDKISQLKRELSRKRARVKALQNKNQNLEEKLEALKAIETSINQ